MSTVSAFLLLLAGVGVFISGMNMLSEGLERTAGGGLKKLLGKISDNRFAGVGVGAAVTALVQSSTATSVMAIGFVNAGAMSLFQATAIIMGANIGTTVTGLLVSLKSLPVSQYAATLAFVGVMMQFFRRERIKQMGGILCGFGLLFVGLDLMSSSFKNSSEINAFFIDLFQKIRFPVLLILCGAIFTAIIQSSSAATGIFITMVGSGALGLENALFLVLGSNIGTCVTAILACLGASTNAKRAAMIHLAFNVVGTVVFAVFLTFFKMQTVEILSTFFKGNTQMQLAWFHVVFNVVTTALLLPFVKYLVWLSKVIIREKKGGKVREKQLSFVDERLLKTPPVALMQVKREILYMSALARENFEKAIGELCLEFKDINKDTAEEIAEKEEIIDFTNKTLTKYLIKLSPLLGARDERAIGSYFHVLNDLERIGDHAENFHEIAQQMQNETLSFSQIAKTDIAQMCEKILQMYTIAVEAFQNKKTAKLSELTRLEKEVDGMEKELSARHFIRLAEGECRVEVSAYFFSVVTGLERVADHLINIGYSILSPTGSQSESKILKKKRNS